MVRYRVVCSAGFRVDVVLGLYCFSTTEPDRAPERLGRRQLDIWGAQPLVDHMRRGSG